MLPFAKDHMDKTEGNEMNVLWTAKNHLMTPTIYLVVVAYYQIWESLSKNVHIDEVFSSFNVIYNIICYISYYLGH